MSSIYVFSYFPFGFEGRIWDLIVSVPDHCLSFYFQTSKSDSKINFNIFPTLAVTKVPNFQISVAYKYTIASWFLCMAGYPNFGAIQISVQCFHHRFSLYGRLYITFFNKADGHLIVRENGIETTFLIYYLEAL